MLRHDIRAALQGVIGAVGQIEAAGLHRGPRCRSSVSRRRPDPRRLRRRSCSATSPKPGRGAGDRRLETLIAHVRRRHAAEAARPRLSLVGRGRGGRAGRPSASIRAALGRIARQSGQQRAEVQRHRHGPARRWRAPPDGSVVFRVTDDGPGLRRPTGAVRRPVRRTAQRARAPHRPHLADRSAAELCARQPAGGRRRGGAALPRRGRRRAGRAGAAACVRPRRAPRAARRGQPDQPDGRARRCCARSTPR